MPAKKYIRKKAKKIMLCLCDRKSQVSGILTEQLNPRDFTLKFDPYS